MDCNFSKPWDIRVGDVLDRLREMPDNSVHCVVTSPPYWGLRDYGVEGQIGLEPTPEAYVENIVRVFREVRRVLRPDGTLWLNLGDSYAGSWGAQSRDHAGKHAPNVSALSANQIKAAQKRTQTGSLSRTPGLKPKDVVGIPWRVAFALQADGWYLRSDVIWSKPNPMPESVTDRPTKAHEYIFLLTKSERYFYDVDAVKEPACEASIRRISQPNFANQKGGPKDYQNTGVNTNRSMRRVIENLARNYEDGKQMQIAAHSTSSARRTAGLNERWDRSEEEQGVLLKRNKRTVWEIGTTPYKGAHFATFPPRLIEPCILAGTSAYGVCVSCGAPYQQQKRRTKTARTDFKGSRFDAGKTGGRLGGDRTQAGDRFLTVPGDWEPTCDCVPSTAVPATVLDPFVGAGTTLLVAAQHGRDSIGIELNPEYAKLAEARLNVPPKPKKASRKKPSISASNPVPQLESLTVSSLFLQ